MNRYPYYPAGQAQTGQPIATALVTALVTTMELVVAATVVIGIVVAYEYSEHKRRRR